MNIWYMYKFVAAVRIILAKINKIDPAVKPEVKYSPADAAPSPTTAVIASVPIPTGVNVYFSSIWHYDKILTGIIYTSLNLMFYFIVTM